MILPTIPKTKRCNWFLSTHGCQKVKGHANKHRCDCGVEWNQGTGWGGDEKK